MKRSHHSAIYHDGSVYFYGGYDGSTCTTLSTIDKYHIFTESWSQIFKNDEEYARCGHSAIFHNNSMIIFGGYYQDYYNSMLLSLQHRCP